MEDLGNYFYWIILAIVALGSLFGKSKKPKQHQQQDNKPTASVPQDWEDVFGELFGTNKPKPQPVLTVETPFTPKPKKQTSKLAYKPAAPSIEELTANEGVRSIDEEKIVVTDIEEDTGGFSLDDVPNDAKEWRTVFVYNEIFNRKY
ncbi:MAG: hypothetical protein LBN11_07115 [Tannerella sp.]|jgi:hypothetical protein|nr:hypothetical protein [Tannerella sp.]